MGVLAVQIEALKTAGIVGKNDVSDNQVKILEKMGLTTYSQAQFFDAEQERNPALKALMSKYEGDMANTGKYDAVLKQIGDRFMAEGKAVGFDKEKAGTTTTILDQLNKDVAAGGPTAQRLDLALKGADPKVMAGIAESIPSYQAGKLSQVLTVAGAPQVAAPAPVAAAPATAPAPAPAAAPAKAQPKPEPARPAPPAVVPPEPVRVAAEPAAPAAAAPAAAAPKPTGVIDPAAISRMSDAQVSALMQDPNTVKTLTESVAKFAEKNFADSIGRDANKFRSAVNATDLNAEIGKNLAQNPRLVRTLAQMAGPEGEAQMKDPTAKSFVKSRLEEIFAEPKKLANKGYTDGVMKGIDEMTNPMNMMAGFLGKMGLNFGSGNELGKMFAGLGRQFEQAFGKMFGGGGGFSMANAGGAGLFGKISLGWQQADRDVFLSQFADTKPQPGKTGPVSDGNYRVETKTPEGKTKVETKYDETRDHRIAITTVDGQNTKVFATDGLSPTRDRDGNFSWSLATKVGENGSPVPGSIQTFRLDQANSEKLFREMQQAGIQNVRDPSTIPNWRGDPPPAGPQISRIDPATGRNVGDYQMPQVAPGPVPTGPARVEPQVERTVAPATMA